MNKEQLELLNRILINANIKAYEIEIYTQICNILKETFINEECKENVN